VDNPSLSKVQPTHVGGSTSHSSDVSVTTRLPSFTEPISEVCEVAIFAHARAWTLYHWTFSGGFCDGFCAES